MAGTLHDVPLIHGELHAGCFLYLRCDATDADILDTLGFTPHTTTPLPSQRAAFVGTQGPWRYYADWYQLANQPSWDEVVLRAAQRWELVALVLPDVDASYEFAHYLDGRIARRRWVSSPHYTDRVVRIDEGRPLRCESEALFQRDGADICWTMAAELGILSQHDPATVRRYYAPW